MNIRMNRPLAFTGIAVLLILFIGLWVVLTQREQQTVLPTVKCKVFSKISIDADEGELVFSIIENIQFYEQQKGIIGFEGYVKFGDKRTYLERTVHLKKGKIAGENAYIFSIDRIDRSALDNTPDNQFSQMWLELSENDSSISLGVKPIRENVYLVSSSLAPQFSCVTY